MHAHMRIHYYQQIHTSFSGRSTDLRKEVWPAVWNNMSICCDIASSHGTTAQRALAASFLEHIEGFLEGDRDAT